MEYDVQLDARGLRCPEPLMLVRNKIRELPDGNVLQVLATDPDHRAGSGALLPVYEARLSQDRSRGLAGRRQCAADLDSEERLTALGVKRT